MHFENIDPNLDMGGRGESRFWLISVDESFNFILWLSLYHTPFPSDSIALIYTPCWTLSRVIQHSLDTQYRTPMPEQPHGLLLAHT